MGETRNGQCLGCKRADGRRYSKRAAKSGRRLPPPYERTVLVDAILMLVDRIENEPRKWLAVELKTELAALQRRLRELEDHR